MNYYIETAILLTILPLYIFAIIGRKKKKKNKNDIIKPFKYLIDVCGDNVSVYELDVKATNACNLIMHYYSQIIFSNGNTELIEQLSVATIKNDSFIYTNDIEELYTVLKANGKLTDWMMTRIHV